MVKGLAPCSTPQMLPPDLVIAALAMLPSVLLACLIDACMLTGGDSWAAKEFVNVKITSQAAPASNPPEVTLSASVPVDCVQTPLVPSQSEVDETLRLWLSGVFEPVSPSTVTVEPTPTS